MKNTTPTVTIRPVNRCKLELVPSSASYVIYLNRKPALYVARYEGKLCTKPIDAPPSQFYNMTNNRSLKSLLQEIKEEQCQSI